MNKTLKGIALGALALLVFISGAGEALAASLNSHARDFATLRVRNATVHAGTNQGWSTTAFVNAGDRVEFAIYYHNNSTETAQNVRMTLSPRTTGSGTFHSFVATVYADNASAVSGNVTVNVGSARPLSFIDGSVAWKPNQQIFGSTSLLFGQNGSELFNGIGLNLGNIGPSNNFATQGSVVLAFRAGDTPNQTLRPTASTNVATNLTSSSARLNGIAFTNGVFTNGRFEWGTSPTLGNVTNLQGLGSATAISFAETLFGLAPNTTYFYRAVADNGNGTGRGEVFSFRTNSSTFVPPTTGGTVAPRSAVDIEKSVTNLTDENGTRDSVRADRGDTLRFTITVKNDGNTTLRNAKIVDRIPSFLEFANSEREVRTTDQREVVWILGDLAPGERETVQLDVVVTEDAPRGITIENVARLESTTITQTSDSVLINLDVEGSLGNPVAGAAAALFGGTGFLPDTLLEWLVTIAVIFGLILLFRYLTAEVEFRRAQRMAAINGMK